MRDDSCENGKPSEFIPRNYGHACAEYLAYGLPLLKLRAIGGEVHIIQPLFEFVEFKPETIQFGISPACEFPLWVVREHQ